jgi:hypothetical protein
MAERVFFRSMAILSVIVGCFAFKKTPNIFPTLKDVRWWLAICFVSAIIFSFCYWAKKLEAIS